MNPSDFILIQVNESDQYYEVARVRPYFFEDGRFDRDRGYYCEGIAQNNGSVYEFQLHLGIDENINYIHLGGRSEIPYLDKLRVLVRRNEKMEHEFSEKVKETYFPFWEEMREEILAGDPYPYPSPSPEFVSELQSILVRAYMQALEIGFNEGMCFQINKTTKK